MYSQNSDVPSSPGLGERGAEVGSMTAFDEILGDLPLTLTIEEAARYLGISRSTAYRLAAVDDLPVPVLQIGRSCRVPTAPLLELLGLPTTTPHSDSAAQSDETQHSATPAAPVERTVDSSPATGLRADAASCHRAVRIPLHNCRGGW